LKSHAEKRCGSGLAYSITMRSGSEPLLESRSRTAFASPLPDTVENLEIFSLIHSSHGVDCFAWWVAAQT
jgi:hypothetical protein